MFVLFVMRREKMRNNHQNVQASSQEFLGTVSVIIPLVHVHLIINAGSTNLQVPVCVGTLALGEQTFIFQVIHGQD